ncbi:MAG: TonB-dependent receptor [candidate division WOR-3 bacterium]|nr:TonB-dependent receptor [candidate division WOR-3 bacterium]
MLKRAAKTASLALLVWAGLTASRLEAATVSGFVNDGRTGEPLPFATVYLSDQSAGTVSDRSGYYVLSGVPAGERSVVYSMIGYRPVERRFVLKRDEAARFDARLENEPIPVRGVTVSAARERFKREVDVGVRRLDIKDLKMAPGMIEQDLFRSLATLPGVVAVSDFSSALYVRGGSPDQNLILLDGVTVYNPYHLGGLFSTFNLDAVSNAELHAGAFPAEYGGAVSSVLDVEMKRGNSERLAGKWDVGLLTTKLMFEGPIPKGSFLIAGRRTYIDAVTWAIDELVSDSTIRIYLPYYFYDLQAKANFDLSPQDRLTLSGYSGDDVIYMRDSISKMDFRWGNYTLASMWRHIFSPKVLATTMLTHGRNRVGLAAADYPGSGMAGDTSESDLTMHVSDVSLKEDFTVFVDSGSTFRFGAEAKRFDLSDYLGADTVVFWNLHERPWYAALYAADKWRPWQSLLINAGVRTEYFTGGGYFRASPRVSAKYFLREDLAVSAGYGLYYQYLSIPFPRDEMVAKLPATFFQQWIPANDKYEPASAAHYVLGGEKWFGDDVQVSVEGYYKQMANLLETGSMLPGIGEESGTGDTVMFNVGSGWSAGGEVLLRRKGSWVGYSLAVTRRTFDSSSFYPIFDARHNFNIAWTTSLGRGWNLNLQWLFRSGFPYTGPIGQFQYVGEGGSIGHEPGQEQQFYYWIPLSGRRGNYRLPPYHRLDVGVEKGFKLFGIGWTGYLQVINVYAQKNVLWYNYNTDENGRVVREPFTILPIPIPSFGVRGGF